MGGLAWAELHFARPVSVHVSPHDQRAEEVVAALRARFPGVVHPSASVGTATTATLLFLSTECFEGDRGARLAAEMKAELERGSAPLMVYDPAANPFGDIIAATTAHAPALKDLKLFDQLAIEWRTGAMGEVSVRIVAQKLGASRALSWWRFACRRVRPSPVLRLIKTRGGALIDRGSHMSVSDQPVCDGGANSRDSRAGVAVVEALPDARGVHERL